MMLNTSDRTESKQTQQANDLHGTLFPAVGDGSLISRRASATSAPLSFEQQQVWLLAQLLPDTSICHEFVAVHLSGFLDVSALEQSLNEIIKRHEIWCTSFIAVDGQPVQRIHPAVGLTLPMVDLRPLPQVERETEVQRRAREQAQQRFDLAQGPLVRALLLQLGEEEHYLCVTVHQLICDRVALSEVFLPELRALYDACSTGEPSPLSPLPIQYADYVHWQREKLTGDRLATHLAYWKEHLAGAPTGLELSGDHPHPAQPTYRGAIQSFALSKQLSGALQILSQQEGVTLQMTLMAALQTLLYRYTGQEDLLLGMTTKSRTPTDVQGLLGYFLNTLVLRTNLSAELMFRELLEQVREVSLEAQAHEIPFEMLVRELQPERTVGVHPLFQVLLTLEPPQPALSGWAMTRMNVQAETSQYDLALHLTECPEGLTGHFAYNSDLFDATTIARMVGHWQTLLEAIVADAAQPIATLPLLTEAERHQILVEWNATQTAYPKEKCVHQLFEEQVERTPEAIAVVFEDKQLTYRELNRRANQLAHHLQKLGVGPEVLVGICVERSLEMVVGLLGILKAGGAYVPLDPKYPHERLAFMLEDARVSVLLTQQRLVEAFPDHSARVVCLDTDWPIIAQLNVHTLHGKAASQHPCYVIYTSGSTGRPKGVMLEHGALVNLLIWNQTVLPSVARTLQYTSLSFDVGFQEIFLTWCSGGTLVLISEELRIDIKRLAAFLMENNIERLFMPFVALQKLAEACCAQEQFPFCLKDVITAGEQLVVTQPIARLFNQLRDCSLHNQYGPSESHVVTEYILTDSPSSWVMLPPIGRPIANTQIYLLDHYLQPVPIGVPGELYIGGAGLAREYLNRPELTDERFIPDPLSQRPGARLYKTGDLARYLPDGNIEFLGRLDHQVKVRGYRIEPGEIEAILSQHPAVRAVVVVAREDVPGDKRLVAYVVFHQGQTATVSDLRDHVTKALPTYMVPSAFVWLEVLPLTPNGKVDRRALPAPEPTRRTMEEISVAPTLVVHHQLKAIWEELLDERPIGIRDNFFYLGGHSLLAARLIDRIEQDFKKKIPFKTLFAGPTIEQLANVLQEQGEMSSRSPVMAIQSGGSKRPFFFLHGQWKEGNAFFCYSLARGLGADQPFYLLEPYSFDGLQVPPTIEEIAASHVKSLRAVQPEGPYLLGGWCNGALLAYEIARQLHEQGQAINLLALMEPDDLVYPARIRGLRYIIRRLGDLLRLGPDKQLDWFLRLRHVNSYLRYADYRRLIDAERLDTTIERERKRRREHMGFALPRLDAVFPTVKFLRQYPYIYIWVASGYAPRSLYPGKVTFFWHRDEPFSRAGWRQVVEANEVEIYIVPGTQKTLLTEHIHLLAEHLKTCLSKVQADTSNEQA